MVRSVGTFRGDGLSSSARSTLEMAVLLAPRWILFGDMSKPSVRSRQAINMGTYRCAPRRLGA